LIPGQNNVTSQPQVNSEYGFLWPLHIIFGLINIFVKAVDQNSSKFLYIEQVSKGLQGQNKTRDFCGPPN
jgi:hypothetical protein